MDAMERERLREAARRMNWPDDKAMLASAGELLALFNDLEAAEAARDAAHAEREQLTAALKGLTAAVEHLQCAIREGFEDHQWREDFAGNLLDDAMLECDGALSVADVARATVAAAEREGQ